MTDGNTKWTVCRIERNQATTINRYWLIQFEPQRVYPMVFSADGTFRAEEVQPQNRGSLHRTIARDPTETKGLAHSGVYGAEVGGIKVYPDGASATFKLFMRRFAGTHAKPGL